MSNNEKTMVCPFCDEQLRFGVRVCRGCQAEITYDNSEDLSGGAGIFGFLFLGLSYALFFTGFTGDSLFDKLTNGTFWGFLLLDAFFIFCVIGAMANQDQPISQKSKPVFTRK